MYVMYVYKILIFTHTHTSTGVEAGRRASLAHRETLEAYVLALEAYVLTLEAYGANTRGIRAPPPHTHTHRRRDR